MSRALVVLAAVALAQALAPALASAQAAAPPAASASGSSAAERLGPRTTNPALLSPGPRLQAEGPAALEPTAAAVAAKEGKGESVTFMIVGGALFAAGLIAGGDAGTVMVLAGAGIGAYGLYLYFR